MVSRRAKSEAIDKQIKKLGAEYNGHSSILGISWQSKSAINKYAGNRANTTEKYFATKKAQVTRERIKNVKKNPKCKH